MCLFSRKFRLRTFKKWCHQIALHARRNLGIFVLSVFITLCIFLPLRCPTGQSYFYLKLSEIKDDIMPCSDTSNSKLQQCPIVLTNLSSFQHVKKTVNEKQLASLAKTLNIISGGRWRPTHCQPLQKVAIIIPYRRRENHLKIFLQHMHRFLQLQLLDYGIFVVEQSEKHDFNRGKLFNIGFVEALKQDNYCCFIFHDVDLLPESPQHIYSCSKQPRHMCSALDTFRYVLPYRDIFGGVVAFRKEHYNAINGYSNIYFGWGGEDDDLAERLKAKGMTITRWESKVSRFTMLYHNKAVPNPNRFYLLKYGEERFNSDGLRDLHYSILKVELLDLYTRILVDVRP